MHLSTYYGFKYQSQFNNQLFMSCSFRNKKKHSYIQPKLVTFNKAKITNECSFLLVKASDTNKDGKRER